MAGMKIEAERPEDRNTEFHKKIVAVKPIPNTRTGHFVVLECGHQVMTFGNLRHAQGKAFCVQCRKAAINATTESDTAS
jgi:hypothetical protein